MVTLSRLCAEIGIQESERYLEYVRFVHDTSLLGTGPTLPERLFFGVRGGTASGRGEPTASARRARSGFGDEHATGT